jgi:hypothetical protein
MGSLFGSSCKSYVSSIAPTTNIAPSPSEFNLLALEECNRPTIALVEYPRCTNLEGKKLLLYRSISMQTVKEANLLDPHFSEYGLSPLARFFPNEEGLKAARLLAEALSY